MALRMIIDKATGFAAKHYQKAVASQLQQTGKFLYTQSTCSPSLVKLFQIQIYHSISNWYINEILV